MTDQYYKNPDNSSEFIGEIAKDTHTEEVKSDSFADRTPVDEALINDTPMGGTVASVEPLSGPLPEEIQMFETPNQEIPMGGTIAAVGPMDEPVVTGAPMEEVVIPKVVDSTPDETWENKLGNVNLYNDSKYQTNVDEPIVDEPIVDDGVAPVLPVVPVVPFVASVPPPFFKDESLPENAEETKDSDVNPCDDPMDEIERQKVHVATTGGLAN